MGTFLIFVGLIGMGVALTAVIRGRLRWARLRSRGMAGLVLAGAVVVTGVGASLSSAATTPRPVAAPAPTTTIATVVPTTVAPATTTVAPTTTTTVKVVAPTTHTHAVVRTTTHTAPKPPPSFTCAASMSNPHPSHNETTDVVVRTGRSGATVDAVAHYKTKDTEHEVHSSGSTVDVPFDISRATYDYPVDVDVTVEVGGVAKSCSTSFTPEP